MSTTDMKLQVTPEQLEAVKGLLELLGIEVVLPTTSTPSVEEKETHIGIALDGSSSMEDCKAATISAHNETVDTLNAEKEKGGQVFTTTLIFRGSAYNQPYNRPWNPAAAQWAWNLPPQQNRSEGIEFLTKHISMNDALLAKISEKTYKPRGNTPMYDGILTLVEELEKYDTPGGNKAFLVSIFTDGEENASRHGAAAELSAKIKALQATGRWTFTVAGANVDLTNLAQTLNIPQMNTLRYAATNEGTQSMGHQNSSSLSTYMGTRGIGGQSVNDFYSVPQDNTGMTPEQKQILVDAINTGTANRVAQEKLWKLKTGQVVKRDANGKFARKT